MFLVYLFLASLVAWFILHWFFSKYSFANLETFEERFLVNVRSNENDWKAFKCSMKSDAKSRWTWLCSTSLVWVFFIGILLIVAQMLEASAYFLGVLFVVNIAISAYKVAKVNRSKLAVENLEGECSLEILGALEKRWDDKKLVTSIEYKEAEVTSSPENS